jgi:hypothetical protein
MWLLAASLSLAAVTIAVADDSQPAGSAGAAPPQQAPAKPASEGSSLPAQPPAAAGSGLLHQLGVWWNDGFGNFGSKMKDAKAKIDDLNKQQNLATQDALKNAAQATKDAATAVVRLPGTRMFELHDRCQPAANGAPDCQAAAASACRGKGFAEGKPMGVSTSQVCPPAVLLSGRRPGEGECRDETYILGVVCQ